jgi:cell wall-associated NlpC family hydrolase
VRLAVVGTLLGGVLIAVVFGGCVAALAGSANGTAVRGTGVRAVGPAVPADWEVLDQDAASTCPGLPWAILAAIGRVESDSGRSRAPGVASGANPAGAEGPMQFEPATFAAYAVVGPGGVSPPSPYDPVDAVYSAARMLCADGAADTQTLAGALEDYNHSLVYVQTVMVLAQALSAAPNTDSAVADALGYAAGALGTPYEWGGSGPGGFDCSGLVQAAYGAGGVSLPRVAQDQFDAGPALGAATTVAPGDLVFFGESAQTISHVGIYVADGVMIDAPHTGAVVREEPANWPDFVGATRPG